MLKKMFLMSVISILLNSCLTFRAITQKITFDDNFNQGRITVTFKDIGSYRTSYSSKMAGKKPKAPSAAEIDSLKANDFSEVLEYYEGNRLLLDELDRGIYITDRRLDDDSNRLNFIYDGIFNKLKLDDDNELKVLKDIITITFEMEDAVERVESNGQVEQKENLVTITWPKSAGEFVWTLHYKSEEIPVYSLIDNYRNWQKEKGSR